MYVERRFKGVWYPVNPPPQVEMQVKYRSRDFELNFGQYMDPPSDLELLAEQGLPFDERAPLRVHSWYMSRNYPLFGDLAGVRGGDAIIEPRGLPEDVSQGVRVRSGWTHSHSWMTLSEMAGFFSNSEEAKDSIGFTGLREHLRRIAAEYNINEDDVRIVFFFDS